MIKIIIKRVKEAIKTEDFTNAIQLLDLLDKEVQNVLDKNSLINSIIYKTFILTYEKIITPKKIKLDLEDAYDLVKTHFNLTKTRTTINVYVNHAFCAVYGKMKENDKRLFSNAEIGKVINKDRTTVLHSINVHNELIEKNDFYSEIYCRVHQLLKEKEENDETSRS